MKQLYTQIPRIVIDRLLISVSRDIGKQNQNKYVGRNNKYLRCTFCRVRVKHMPQLQDNAGFIFT